MVEFDVVLALAQHVEIYHGLVIAGTLGESTEGLVCHLHLDVDDCAALGFHIEVKPDAFLGGWPLWFSSSRGR